MGVRTDYLQGRGMFWQGVERNPRGSSQVEVGMQEAEMRRSCRPLANVMPLTRGKVISVSTQGKRKRVRKAEGKPNCCREDVRLWSSGRSL